MTEENQNNPTDGNDSSEWFSSLPDELQQDKTLQRHKTRSLNEFAQDFLNTKKAASSALRIPKEDAKPEEWDQLYSKLGRPENPEQYELPEFQVPEGFEFKQDEGLIKQFNEAAHKSGINPSQYKALAQVWFNNQIEQLQTLRNSNGTNAREELIKVWGSNDTVEENQAIAVQALENYFPKDLVDQITTELTDKPAFIQGLYHLGKTLGEGKIMDGTTSEVSLEDQMAEVDSKIGSVRANPQYFSRPGNKDHNATEHRNLKTEISELYEQKRQLNLEKQKQVLREKFAV